MRYIGLFISGLLFLLSGCGQGGQAPDKEAKRDTIANLQDSLKTRKKPEALKQDAKRLVKHLREYINQYPKDTVNPEYLYTIGNYQFNYLRNPKKAIDRLEQLRNEYPEHERTPFALFTQGFMYQKLDQTDLAREKYETFLDKYPDHELAKDVKLSIKGLGLSTKEQLEQAEQMQKEKGEGSADTTKTP